MNLPEEFVKNIENRFNLSGSDLEAFKTPPPKSIRVNRYKPLDMSLGSIPWTTHGYFLTSHPIFMHDPRWLAGAYFVQSSTSMMIELAWNTMRNEGFNPKLLLDLCGAPGGKTTQLLDLMDIESLLLVNEVHPKRVRTLTDNLWRWGNHRVLVTQQKPASIRPPTPFDFILVDAPCSGEGLFAEFPKAIEQWSPQYVQTCHLRQREIMESADRLLAPGGYMIYSTCTYNEQENGDIVRFMLKKEYESVPLSVSSDQLLTMKKDGVTLGYQALPNRIPGRGFFFSLLRKKGAYAAQPLPKSPKPSKNAPAWLALQPGTEAAETHSGWSLIASKQAGWLKSFQRQNKTYSMGTALSDSSGQIRHIAAALHYKGSEIYETVDLNLELTLRYLKGEALPSLGQGWKVAQYQGFGMGWVKSLPKRSNNLYPKPWRLPPSIVIDQLSDFFLN